MARRNDIIIELMSETYVKEIFCVYYRNISVSLGFVYSKCLGARYHDDFFGQFLPFGCLNF